MVISALMSVYNGEKFLKESIQSVLNQTFTDFELIIVDDGSTDGSVGIINEFEDKRIRLIKLQENVGLGKALSIGLEHVTGEYVARVDADDLYHPERFQKQLDFLRSNRHISVVDSEIEYFSDEKEIEQSERFRNLKLIEEEINSIHKTEHIKKELYHYVCITHSSIMFDKEILQLASYNDVQVVEDYDLFYKWNKSGVNFAKLKQALTYVRVSNGSTTATQHDKIVMGLIDIKKEEIIQVFNCNKYVYIWGTGSLADKTYQILSQADLQISGFIDRSSDKIGSLFNGEKVSDINELLEFKRDIGILVCASPIKHEIADVLEDIGFEHLEDYLIIF